MINDNVAMSYFNFNYKKCYYTSVGGNPLLLLHGNAASSAMFADVVQYYVNQFEIYLIDFLGHDFYEITYTKLLTKIPNGSVRLFQQGGHHAMLSNADEFAKLAKNFFRLTI